MNTQAADGGLHAALKRLVTEASAPFSELDNLPRRVAADKTRSDVSIETVPRYLKGERPAHDLAAKGPKLPKPDLKDDDLK